MPGVSLVEQEDGKFCLVCKETDAVLVKGLSHQKAKQEWAKRNTEATKKANAEAIKNGTKRVIE